MRPLAEPANFDPRRRRGLGNLGNRRHKLGELDAAAAAAAVLLRFICAPSSTFSRPSPAANVAALLHAAVGTERPVWVQPASFGVVAEGQRTHVAAGRTRISFYSS